MKPVLLVQNSKGGVGKSTVTMSLMDWSEAQGVPAHLVESDNSNSDTGVIYQRTPTPVSPLNLDIDAGWMDFANLCEQETERLIVVNGAARNLLGLQDYGAIMASVQALRPVITLWVLDTLEDSVSLLADYLDAMSDEEGRFIGAVHALCNEGKAATRDADFSIYEHSKVARRVRALNGRTVRYPKLAERLLRQLFTGERKTVGELAATGPLGNRAEARRWQRLVHRRFQETLGALR